MPDTRTPSGHWADALQDRLIDFAVRVIKLADDLPNTPAGRHIAGQILRSATSPPPNYAEGRVAESRDDFIHKLKIVLKELNETLVWLQFIVRARLLPSMDLKDLVDENDQLCRLIGSSVATAKANHPRHSSKRPDRDSPQ